MVIQSCFHLLMLKEKSVQEEVDIRMDFGGSQNACNLAALGKFVQGLLELVNMF